jgi:hypothetical protein
LALIRFPSFWLLLQLVTATKIPAAVSKGVKKKRMYFL